MALAICGSLLIHLEAGAWLLCPGVPLVRLGCCVLLLLWDFLFAPGWLCTTETTAVLQSRADRDPRVGCRGHRAPEDGWETSGKPVVLPPPSYLPFYLY